MKLTFLGTRGEIEARTALHNLCLSLGVGYRSSLVTLARGLRGAASIRASYTSSFDEVTNATITRAIFSPPIEEGSMEFA